MALHIADEAHQEFSPLNFKASGISLSVLMVVGLGWPDEDIPELEISLSAFVPLFFVFGLNWLWLWWR